jgi:hypothetical protein
MTLNAKQFEEAVRLPDKIDRDIALQSFVNDAQMNVSVTEIIAIAQMVCGIGCGTSPSPDSLCAVINSL